MAVSGSTITTVDYKYFGRVGRVEILENGKALTGLNLDGLDFEFQTSELWNDQPNENHATATVKILGLTQEHVDYLCQHVAESSYLQRNIAVRVLAGYETDSKGAQELFCLPVAKAEPSAMPENWVTLTLRVDYTADTSKSVSTSVDTTTGTSTAYQMMVDAAYSLNSISWRWMGNAQTIAKNIQVAQLNVTGGTSEVLDAIREKCPFLSIVQLPSVSNGSSICEVYVNDDELEPYKTRQNTWNINSATGMIGVPSWSGADTTTSSQVKVKTLLNPSYKIGDTVNLKSVIAADLSQDGYRIVNVSHEGHLRGDAWYSNLTLQIMNSSTTTTTT